MELSGGWVELGGAGWSWVHGLVIPEKDHRMIETRRLKNVVIFIQTILQYSNNTTSNSAPYKGHCME